MEDEFTAECCPLFRFYLMNKFTTDDSDADNVYYTVFAGKTFPVDDFSREMNLAVGVS